MKKLKKLFCAFFAFVLMGTNLGGVIPVFADEPSDPTVRNPEGPTVLSNGAKLYKTAASVPGYANMWRVTLRIETPIIETTSDTVLVIDNSNSMNTTTNGTRRITEAIAAAKTLAAELLPEGNTTNRIAVVSFNGSVTTRVGFSDTYSDVESAINATSTLSAGTHTQAGMHTATSLIQTSTADIKNIVLLSDGEPSYSYAFTDSALEDDNNFVAYNSGAVQTSKSVAKTVFDYTKRAGGGNGMRTCIDSSWPCTKYYNHGHSAIAEAGYYKALGIGDLYTIAVGAGTNGEAVLSEMASSSEHYYEAEDGELDTVFEKITGKIKAAIESANVHDVMGEGVIVENAQHSTELDWKPKFTYDSVKKIYWAEYTYDVEANEHILDENSTDGFHPLNKNATLTYNNNQTGAFPVPYVKPFFVNVKKEIVGQECEAGECMFDFKIEHPAGLKETDYSVEAGKTHRIVEAFPIGDYTLTEIGETSGSGNPVKFENYLVSYTGNQFTIAEQHADHIDVTITNTYETVDISASKEWNDDEDRDGLRKNYSNLYMVVKDGSNYAAHEKVTGATTQSFKFEDLPKNRNGAEIQYTIGEATCTGSETALSCTDFASDSKYTSTVVNGVVTNMHEPEKTTLTIKKIWDTSAGTLPSTTPNFVTVEVTNDKNTDKKTVTLKGDGYTEWTGDFEDFKYEKGEEITYSVREKDIAGGVLNSNNTLYVYKDAVLEGKWVATRSGAEITNTWTPATTVYSGSGAFNIEKLDQDGKAVPNVTFAVGDKNYTTGSNGKVKVEFSKSADKPKDNYTFNIKETEAPEYYDVLEGTEVLTATTSMKLTVDEEKLTNTYAKTFAISVKTAADGYCWRDSDKTLVVSDQALAKELVVEKTFEGITTTAFQNNSQISFEITGPKGFTKMTLGIDDEECKISGSKVVCKISGEDALLPVGEYTVTEKNADITNFTYQSEPTSGKVSQTAELGDSVKFSLKNTYKPAKTASYKVAKVWDDDSNRDGIQPKKLKVTLYAGGKAYGEPVELTPDGGWAYEWAELPIVNENAETIQYSVREADTSKYTSDGGKMVNGAFTFTNTHKPELINEEDDDPDNDGKLTVQKIWDGKLNEFARPLTVTIELHAETKNDKGEVVKSWVEGQPVTISQVDDWSHTFDGLYRYDGGLEIIYSVQESKIGEMAFGEDESVIVVYRSDANIENGKWEKKISGNNITNTWTRSMAKSLTIKKTTVGVLAEVLTDLEFTVTGPEDFGKNGKMTLKLGKGCTASGYKMTCTVDGDVPTGVYTVKESNTGIEHFTLVKPTGDNATKNANPNADVVFEMKNEYVSDKISYYVVKIWDDEHDKNKVRPGLILINLYDDNGEVVSSHEMTADDEYMWDDLPEELNNEDVWFYEFAGLPMMNEKAEIIYYTAEEDFKSNNYEQIETGGDMYSMVFVNHHEVTDPCADGGGCGGGDIIPPDTGELTNLKREGAVYNGGVSFAVGGFVMVMLGGVLMMVVARKRQR